MPSPQAPRIRGFDGIRGLASSAVVVQHAAIYHTKLGELAVLAFFVLSGYLIVGILHRSRAAIEAGSISLKVAFIDFWIGRIRRTCPIYFVALAVVTTFGVLALQDYELLTALPWYLTYLQNFYVALVRPAHSLLMHTWSLAIEQQFYLLFAPALLLMQNRLHVRVVACVLAASFVLWLAVTWSGIGVWAATLLPMYGSSKRITQFFRLIPSLTQRSHIAANRRNSHY